MSEHTHSDGPAQGQAEPFRAELALPIRLAPMDGQQGIQTVSARDLHGFLEVGKDFSTWIKDRISGFGFQEGQDFVTAARSPISGSGNRGASTEYFLTLDMAKELAMVERNDRGRQARRYFIACERQLRTGAGAITALGGDVRQVLGGIVKGIVVKALDEALAPMERVVLNVTERMNALTSDPAAFNTVEFRPMLAILKDMDVPAKGRRGLSSRLSKSIFRWLVGQDRGADIRLSRETGRYLFHVTAVDAWLEAEGKALIVDHKVRLEGQGILRFPGKKKPKPTGRGAN